MSERISNITAEIAEQIDVQGYAIGPPIGKITHNLENWQTAVKFKANEEIATQDTLVLMDHKWGPEGIWPHQVDDGYMIVVRGFPSAWDVRDHTAGTTIHRLYIDYNFGYRKYVEHLQKEQP